MTVKVLILILILAPLLGFLINALNWRSKKVLQSGILASSTIGISFLSAVLLFSELLKKLPGERHFHVELFSWIGLSSESLNIKFGLHLDSLNLLMSLVITGVGFLIHIFSLGYMSKDPRPAKYFAYLNFFVFNMLLLVLGDNLLLMFVGWEGVGLASYLLIGFWFSSKAKAAAGMKAFITNRVGDAGFLIGIFFLFQSFGTLDFLELSSLMPHQPETKIGSITLACFFLTLGAFGKSAQIPLYVWLPDAMAGPTPVSALIHAATMVTAGIYMIVRLNFLFILSPLVMNTIAIIGACTAFFAATMAITEWDIKKILAYSTVSQLGYMFLALGVGAFIPAIFHLVTHAFFKALLFLGAGAIIYSLHHEQDIRKMGGLRKKMPLTYIVFICGWLALSGFPPLSGFFSKDEILWSSFQSSRILWFMGFITALITAFYSTRLMAWVFWKKPEENQTEVENTNPSFKNKKPHRIKHHSGVELKKIPLSMSVPLLILAFLSIVGGLIGVPHALSKILPWHPTHWLKGWLSSSLITDGKKYVFPEALELTLMGLTVGFICFSFWLAYDLYILHPERSKKLKLKFKKLHSLLSKKYYVDEFYSQKLIQPTLRISNGIWQSIDIQLIDRVTQLLSNFVLSCAKNLSALQRGNLQEYALYFVIGMILAFSFFI